MTIEENVNENENQQKIILVTGATGFVGTHLVRLLVQKGYKVRCLVRRTSDTSRLPDMSGLATGHLLNYESLELAVKDCWGVIHVGGIVRARNPRDFYLTNRDGTGNLTKAAVEAGVERFILCSSQAAGGPSTPDRKRQIGDTPNPITDYGKSKLAGETALTEKAGEMWYSVLRPPSVYGPYDYAFFTVVKWIQMGIKLRIGEGKMLFSIIHVEDLARALVLGIEADQESDQVWYVNDGGVHNVEELTSAIQSAMSKNARWISIPLWAADPAARVMETFANIRGETALFGRQRIAELTQAAWTCDDTPFREATGFKEQFDLSSGFAQTVTWYDEQGWI